MCDSCSMSHDKRKVSLYLGSAGYREMRAEADRQGQSLSWIVQQTWKLARRKIRRYAPPATVSMPSGVVAVVDSADSAFTGSAGSSAKVD